MKTNLQKDYTNACNNYVKAFCEKQGLLFVGWDKFEIGGACMFDYNGELILLSFRDVVYDINSIQPKGIIIEWYKYFELKLDAKDITGLNYFEYCNR